MYSVWQPHLPVYRIASRLLPAQPSRPYRTCFRSSVAPVLVETSKSNPEAAERRRFRPSGDQTGPEF